MSTFLRDPTGLDAGLRAEQDGRRVRAQTPWSDFAAFAILFALPVSAVFFFFQRYIVGGLAIGGVKG